MNTSEGTLRGVVLVSASNLAFCGMACMIKVASEIDSFTTTMFRFVVGLGLIGVAAMAGKVRLTFVDKPLLFVRGLIGGTATLIVFISIVKLGIVKATVICFTYPVFAAILSAVFLGERLGPGKIVAIASAFGGVALVLTGRQGYGESLWMGIGAFEVLAFAGAILGGAAVVMVKKLHDTDSTASIFFAQCLVGLWIVIVPAGMNGISMGLTGAGVLLTIGVLAALGQVLLTEGYRFISVSTGSVLVMISPALNFAAGVLLFREPLSRAAVVGSIVTLASCAVVAGRAK